MESLGSYTRSAARGTYSAYRSVPLRWRLAGGSAALTFVILASFAVIVGVLTNRQVRSQFDNQLISAGDRLSAQVSKEMVIRDNGTADCQSLNFASFTARQRGHAHIRVWDVYRQSLLCAQLPLPKPSRRGDLPFTVMPTRSHRFDEAGYRVVTLAKLPAPPEGPLQGRRCCTRSRCRTSIRRSPRSRRSCCWACSAARCSRCSPGCSSPHRAMSPIKELTRAAA